MRRLPCSARRLPCGAARLSPTWRDVPFARSAARRLTDQRLLALERRIDSDLQLGRAQDLVPELEALVVSDPYHEPFHRQLMLALYRSGRQSDALAAFRRARGLLAGELGIEPGPDLQKMGQAILRQDPALEQPPAARPHRPGPAEPAVPGGPPGPAAASARRRRRVLALITAGVALAVAVAVALGSLAVGGGSGWATSPEGHTVYRIDPATRAITQAISVGAGAGGIAYDDGDVWVANALDGTVSRINSTAGQMVQTTGAGSEPTGVAAGLGAVWVTDPVGSAVYRIDPSSGQVTATIGLASPPYGITVGASARPLREAPQARLGADRWLAHEWLFVLHRGEVRLGPAPARRHVEDIPDRPDQVDVAGLFTFLPRREHQLGRPPVAEPAVVVAREHVQDRGLLTLRRFRVVVAVVAVVPRGHEPQMAPDAFVCEVADPGRV